MSVERKQWSFALLLNFMLIWNGVSSSFITFEKSEYITEEKPSSSVSLTLILADVSNSSVFFTCNLPAEASGDFISTTFASEFKRNEAISTCTFIVQDDNIPEGNETFPVSIGIRNNNNTVLKNLSYITILLNDDPHGFVGFTHPGLRIDVEEPNGATPRSVQFNLTRHGGNIGTVGVLWEITQKLNPSSPDIQPDKGVVNFTNAQTHNMLYINILPDQISELEEIYTIRLVSVYGGAHILSNSSEVEIRIQENDAPLRFRDSEITFTEPETKKIHIYRGLNSNGQRVGPISDEVRVSYETIPGTATAGIDYVSKRGEIVFESGITEKTIDIEVLKDPKPELRETFTVRLLNPSVNVILSNPSELEVIITQNGDPYGVISFNTTNIDNDTVVMDEDNNRYMVSVSIIRTSGTFGNVSVSWIIESPSSVSFSPFVRTIGNAIFSAGNATTNINIEIKQDEIPNEPALFTLSLKNASGGARLKMNNNGNPSLKVLVMDSDNAYGIIEFVDELTSLTQSTTPRRFDVRIQRTGGAIGTLDVYYNIKYFYNGRSVRSPLYSDRGVITFNTAQHIQRIAGEIRNDVFLKTHSYFVITLEKVVLRETTLIRTSSPTLGSFKVQYVNITSNLANGEISFLNAPVIKTITEPWNSTDRRMVMLELIRDGTSAVVTVSWKVSSANNLLTKDDVLPMEGNVTLDRGVNNGTILIEILADDIPEVDEQFIVELVNVTGENEQLKNGATTASVIILENDNPEGIFQFQSSNNVILTETSSIPVNVVRLGGSLKSQSVYVKILNGRDDFSPHFSVIMFPVGVTSRPMYLFPINDNLPEVDETFVVQLSSTFGAVLGSIISFNVTIAANDHPYGVISFAQSSTNLRISELTNQEATILFHISRTKGLFKQVTVLWKVESEDSNLNATTQLRPTCGSLMIDAGLNSATITFHVLRDELPEQNQVFTVKITNVTGGATLSQPSQAKVTILANDFPVVVSPQKTFATEGETVTLSVQLPVALTHDVRVTLETKLKNASKDDFSPVNRVVLIRAGTRSVTVDVDIAEDDEPELEECFEVVTTSTTGDTVLYRNISAEICINPSDSPGGVFVFSNHQIDEVTEGDEIQISVERQQGSFGKVELHWKTQYVDGKPVSANELSHISGSISFENGERSTVLLLKILQDGIPELNEVVELYLYNLTGAYATLGAVRTLNITILANDHPNGLFVLDHQSSAYIFAEDFDGENRANTSGTVYVERTMGSLFKAKVLWVITPLTSGNESLQLMDLLLHGDRSSVKRVEGLNSTKTDALEFFKGSSVKVSNKTQAMQFRDDGFTLQMSLKTNVTEKMQLFETLTQNGSSQFGVTLHGKSLSIEILIVDSLNSIYISMPTSLSDDTWHDVMITVTDIQVDVYVDREHMKTHVSVEPVSFTNGDIYIGGRTNGKNGFVGVLRNVWMYARSFSDREARDAMLVWERFYETSGYLTFEKGETVKAIVVSTTDDAVPEPQMNYLIRIADVMDDRKVMKEQAVISKNEGMLEITVLKSDFANGMFRLSTNSCSVVMTEIEKERMMTVERYHSFVGGVHLSWEILDSNGQLAISEFLAANGSVEFSGDEKTKNISITPLDDSVPERNESFVFKLTTAISTDGQLESSNHSGASVSAWNVQCNVTLISNDNPNGVLQLSSFVPNMVGYIPVRTRPGFHNVSEEMGFLDLYVVRAQGTDGQVSVEWKTVANGTAVGGKDFQENVGKVTLEDGDKSAMITIRIIDNAIPELTKSFAVVLKNPTGEASVTAISSITINIIPSDGALGLFSVVEKKVFAEEGSSVNITVQRDQGSLDAVSVYWRVVNGSSDFEKIHGAVVFGKGVHERVISIDVSEEEVSEGAERFLLTLTNTTGGTINNTYDTTEIIVLPSDHPYGLFSFKSSFVKAAESQGILSVSIVRSKGKLGQVQVLYETTSSNTSNIAATQDVDYMHVNGSLIFLDDEIEKVIAIVVVEDEIPESDEDFSVNITAAELLQPVSRFLLTSMIGSPQQTLVTILKNDDSNGLLEFERNFVNVTEDVAGGILTVVRKRGTFGKISFSFEITEATSTIGADFTVSTFTVSMDEGQQNISLPIFVLSDDDPEFTEWFVVALLTHTISGGARLGKITSCRVNILENDHPYGLIGIAETKPLVLVEPDGNTPVRVPVKVIREWGSVGIVKVQWKITPSSFSSDVRRTEGEVGFLTGEFEKEIYIEVLPDDVPEVNETLTLQLTDVTEGHGSINLQKDSVSVVILENDNPFGVVMFKDKKIIVDERNGSNVLLDVIRRGGLFEDIKVFYRTMEIVSSSGLRRADGISDYKELDSYITIKNGTSHGTISILIYDDVIAELSEYFQVAITKVETFSNATSQHFPMIGTNNRINVVIRENDHPYGLFRISLDNSSSPGNNDKLTNIVEPTEGNIPVEIHIARMFGTFGRVTVSWRLSAVSTITHGIDISGATGGNITFAPGDTRKSFSITINSDDIPEDDEMFSIEMFASSGGAQIDQLHRSVDIVIRANDNAGGVIGFQAGSLSKNVKEGDTFTMSVQRSAPALGRAVVGWVLQGENNTYDFVNSQGTIEFQVSQILANIKLTVKSDNIPEVNEKFLLNLTSVISTGIDSSGAAVLDQSASIAYIMIGASDNPHGVLEFYDVQQPVHASESYGEVDIRIVRQFGKLGQLELFYKITLVPKNSSIATANIQDDIGVIKSSIVLQDGADSVKITIPIVNDDQPEVDEAFYVNLVSVQLLSVHAQTNTTVPPLIGKARTLLVVIDANDGARGVLSFAQGSLNLFIEEKDVAFNLTVIRSRGTFGSVYCFYFLNRLTASKTDFDIQGGVMDGGPAKLVFADGQRSANITVHILDDNETEDLEQFEVGLTTQNAVGNGGVTVSIPSRTVVSIRANDDAHGVIMFSSNSRVVTVAEPSTNTESGMHQFSVERLAGAFGQIIVSWQVLNVSTSTDITPSNGILTFNTFDRRQVFLVKVVNDDVPELEKQLQIRLAIISGGARLGHHSIATLIIVANDNSHGMFVFEPSVIHVDESIRTLQVSVLRNDGLFGFVTVDYETQDVTAKSLPGNTSMFGIENVHNVSKFKCSHSFNVIRDTYLIVISEDHSTLYWWRGVFLKVKVLPFMNANLVRSIEYNTTNNATSRLIVAANTTHITVFTFHPLHLNLLNIQTVTVYGVTDLLLTQLSGAIHLIVSVGVSETGESVNRLKLFEWENNKFVETPPLYQTFYGKTMDIIRDGPYALYLAVGNYYNRIRNSYKTQSYVYKWSDTEKEFKFYGMIETDGVAQLHFFKIDRDLFIGVANDQSACALYVHDSQVSERFRKYQNFNDTCQSLSVFRQETNVYLVMVSKSTFLYAFDHQTKMFSYKMTLPYENIIYYATIVVAPKPLGLFYQQSSKSFYLVSLYNFNNQSDYLHRKGQLMFDEYQNKLSFFITIVKDSQPEDDETFLVTLSNPTNGAVVSPTKGSTEVVIMANDNAYGRVGFANSSRYKLIVEEDHDIAFELVVMREFGTNRELTVWYNVTIISGDDTKDEIYPSHGKIMIRAGQNHGTLTLYLTGDNIPEITEIFHVSLTGIHTSGVTEKGATINYLHRTSEVLVLPNDHPYGVFGWQSSVVVTTEEVERNSSALLVVQRAQGVYGDVLLTYQTIIAEVVGPREQAAQPNVDFTPTRDNVTIHKGQNEAYVSIPIHHDRDVSFNEIFYVNITSVRLVDDSEGSSFVAPTVNEDRRVVQLVITEVIQNNGVVEFTLPSTFSVDEDVGIFNIPVIRHNGSDGSVGVYFELLYTRDVTSSDVTPRTGTVSFAANQTMATIALTINDDDIPELTENFVLRMIKPVGGATIGKQNRVTVRINENDYPHGLFGIQLNSSGVFIKEGQMVNFVVERTHGTYGRIEVSWSCNKSFSEDISIVAGLLVFMKGERMKRIQFMVVDDDIPEVHEHFTCQLNSVSSPAVLGNNRVINVTIATSDNPYGEYMINSNSRNLIVAEPISISQNGKFNISVLRDVGQTGRSMVSWEINSLENQRNNTAQTFSKVFGTLIFESGIKERTIEFQVIDDVIPEESQEYLFKLHSPTNDAVLSPASNSTATLLTVASSGHPYGVFSLMENPNLRVQESDGSFNVIVQREAGLIGAIEISFVVVGDNNGDIVPNTGKTIFHEGNRITTLTFKVTEDAIPELDETFTILLISATLLHKHVDFQRNNGVLQVNTPPLLKANEISLNVTVLENDYPYGLIGFERRKVIHHEWQKVVRIPVIRNGGSFGAVNVSFSHTSISATQFADYNIVQNQVWFNDGQNVSYIEVTLIDDLIPEQQESFVINLQSIKNGRAKISNGQLTFIIETSDNPAGLVGIFNMTSSVEIQNPLTNHILQFPISRLAGTTGEIKVTWTIERTVSSTSLVSEDLFPSNGVVTFGNGQSGSVLVRVTALPYGGPQEGEERFHFTVKQVTGGAAIDESNSKVLIVIKKKGYPNGLFYLSGVIDPSSIIDEPTDTNETLIRIHVNRAFGRLGDVKVRWSVTSTVGDLSVDISFNQSQWIMFAENEVDSFIDIHVLNDDIPELDERFEVRLLSANLEGEIDESRNRLFFTVRENDNPYGVFYLPSNEQIFHLNSTSLQRSLQLTVARDQGAFEACVMSVIVTHTELPPMPTLVEIDAHQTRESVLLEISASSFLQSGSFYTVKIVTVSLKTPGTSLLRPTLDDARSTETIKVPQIAANSIVEIETDSRYVMINPITQMATVTINRVGLYGTITVPWQYGFPSTMKKPSTSPGLLSPAEGSVTISHGSRTGTFIFQPIVPPIIKRLYEYGVHLSADIQPMPNQNGWPRIGVNIYSVIEPHGVVEVSSKSKNVVALEGSTAEIFVVRSFSTVGTIRVTYQTNIHSGINPAKPSNDFVPMASNIDFLEGEFEKVISIEILDDVINPKPEVDEYFYVELLSVNVLSASYHNGSPRFGKNKISNVTIQDNDNPFGTISFALGSRAFSAEETSGFVELTVQRSGGTLSSSTIEILTMGGGEQWTQEIVKNHGVNSDFLKKLQSITSPASATSDYAPFRRNVIFRDAVQQQKVKLNLYKDDIAEPMEELLVLISNATGGAIIFAPHSYAVVSIKANGVYNGLVRFERTVAMLDEDGEGKVQLVVLREGTVKQEIVVSWAVYSNNEEMKKQLVHIEGTINMTIGTNKAFIIISTVQDAQPEYATWFFVNLTSVSIGAMIKSDMNAVNVTIMESDYPAGKIAFDVLSRYPVVQLGENEVELVVRRFNGSMNSIQVSYSTLPLNGITRDGGILLNPAIEGTDFVKAVGVLTFADGQTKSYVKVRLLVDQSTTTSYPKIFNVSLQDASSGAVLSPSYKSSRIVISNRETTGKFLKLRSDLLSVPLTDAKIVELLTTMYKDVQAELTEDEHQLSRTTIDAILEYKSSQPSGQRALAAQAKDLLLNIFNELMSPSRSDSKGHSYWMKLLEKTAFALTNDWSCPTKNIFSRSNFDVTVERQNKSKLNGASFGSDGDFFRYPINMYADAEGVSCTVVQFVDMKNAQWFSGANSVLNNKVLSSSVRSGNVGEAKKVVFRVSAPQNRITPTGVSCVIWDYPTSPSAKGSWSSKNCKIRTEQQKYVECECDHMSEYAVLAQSDDRTGYEIYFFVACYVTMGACFLALVSHHLCAIDKTFPSKLLMHTFFAIMLANVIYVIGAYLSPRLISQTERCSVLGIFVHFAFLSQFTTIFVQVCNLWKILILNDEHSYRKSVTFYIIAWGLPMLIIIGYFFITHAVWDWDLPMMYGDVHGNGDLCFIPHAYAAFSVAVIPVLLFMLAVGVVFVQAYQVTPQWKCYDDIYRGRYNIKEVRHLMILFSLVTLTWLFGGLHIAYGHLWMAIAFTFFNVFTGLDIFFVYVILRNQMRYVFKGKYDISQPMDDIELPHVMYQPANDTTKDMNEWETIDVERVTPVSIDQKMRRSATPMSQRSPYLDRHQPSTNYRRRPTSDDRTMVSNRSNSGLMNESYNNEDDIDEADFDDLIFALKSGGNFTPSIHEAVQGDGEEFDDEDDEIFPDPPPSSDRYPSVRRIKMGDTPL